MRVWIDGEGAVVHGELGRVEKGTIVDEDARLLEKHRIGEIIADKVGRVAKDPRAFAGGQVRNRGDGLGRLDLAAPRGADKVVVADTGGVAKETGFVDEALHERDVSFGTRSLARARHVHKDGGRLFAEEIGMTDETLRISAQLSSGGIHEQILAELKSHECAQQDFDECQRSLSQHKGPKDTPSSRSYSRGGYVSWDRIATTCQRRSFILGANDIWSKTLSIL